MPKLPVVSGKKLLKLLLKHGFLEVRRKGSHVFVEHETSDVRTVIPLHGNEDLGKGMIKAILQDLDIDVHTLQEWLKKR